MVTGVFQFYCGREQHVSILRGGISGGHWNLKIGVREGGAGQCCQEWMRSEMHMVV